MATATLITVLLGLRKVIESISFAAPVLLASVVILSVWTVVSSPSSLANNLDFHRPQEAAVRYWPIAALLYSSCNLVLAIPVLAPMGALTSRKNLRWGAVFGGVGSGSRSFSHNHRPACRGSPCNRP